MPLFGLKPTGRSFKTNEIGLRLPLRAYGAFVVRSLFLLWVFYSLSLFFVILSFFGSSFVACSFPL